MARAALIAAFSTLLLVCFENCAGFNRSETASNSVDLGSETALLGGNTVATSAALMPPQEKIAFGYWGSAMNGAGTGDYINEVAGRGNVVFIREDTVEGVISKVLQAKSRGMKSIIMVQNVFFPWASSSLYPDYEAKFRNLWSALSSHKDWIQGFYLFDEPFYNNAQTPGWQQIYSPFLRDELNTAVIYIHGIASGIPTIVVFSYAELEWPQFYGSYFPREVDWVGFDCYATEGERCSPDHVRGFFAAMMANKEAKQKIVIVPDASHNAAPTLQDDLQKVARLKVYKDMVASNSDVVGVFPFMYQNHLVGGIWGAESMPNLKGELAVYYEGLNGRVRCEGADLVRPSTGARWTAAPVCAPSCEGTWLVTRGADGRQLSSAQSAQCI